MPLPTGLHLYVLQSNITGAVKIGRSSDPAVRLRTLQTGSPYKLKLLAVYEEKGHLEMQIHEQVRRFRLRIVKGEWYHHECLPNLPDWMYEALPSDDRWWLPAGANWWTQR